MCSIIGDTKSDLARAACDKIDGIRVEHLPRQRNATDMLCVPHMRKGGLGIMKSKVLDWKRFKISVRKTFRQFFPVCSDRGRIGIVVPCARDRCQYPG